MNFSQPNVLISVPKNFRGTCFFKEHSSIRRTYCYAFERVVGGSRLNVQAERVGSHLVVRITGELDLHTVNAFRQAIDREIATRRSKNLVLVMSDVSFIDSSGVGAILGRYKSIKAQGGKMVAVGLRPIPRRTLELSGVLRVIQTAESERRALAQLQGGERDAR